MQVVRVLHRMQTAFEKRIGTTRIRDFIRVLRELEEEGSGGF